MLKEVFQEIEKEIKQDYNHNDIVNADIKLSSLLQEKFGREAELIEYKYVVAKGKMTIRPNNVYSCALFNGYDVSLIPENFWKKDLYEDTKVRIDTRNSLNIFILKKGELIK